MSYRIRCTHCQFSFRVQSEAVARAVQDDHEEREACADQCIIDELGFDEQVQRADI